MPWNEPFGSYSELWTVRCRDGSHPHRFQNADIARFFRHA